jgi:hypothetical protein
MKGSFGEESILVEANRGIFLTFKNGAQTASFKNPVRTAL